jgi:UDP-glucose 4-epimerase
MKKEYHKEVWNVASGVETSINELLRIVLRIMEEQQQSIIFLPPRPGNIRRHCAYASKAKSPLGLEIKADKRSTDLQNHRMVQLI